MAMQAEQVSTQQLLLELEHLRQQVKDLKQDKTDLEILLETTTAHADVIERQLYDANQKLQAEIVERQKAEAALQSLLDIVTKYVADLEILLENTTEHGDAIEALLYNKAEEVVRRSEKQLAQFLEAVPVGVFVVDANGQPYYANQAVHQILGQWTDQNNSALAFPELYQGYLVGTNQLYPSDRQPIGQALQGESTTIDDLEIRRPDKVIPLEVWARPIFDEKGEVIYAIAAFRDITQRKQADAERLKFTNQLFKLNQAFSRFVPRQFLQFLHKDSIVDVKLGDQVQQEMSILFADIRDFTTLSEKMSPHENFKFINAFFSRMEPAIIEHQGFIDKYIGDALMALFSAGADQVNGGADQAVKAGISMLQRLADYNKYRLKVGYEPIQVGIGINTGSLMLGTIGGSSRMDSTVISDAVNLASRLEEFTKNYGVSLLISHHTFLQIEDSSHYAFRIIDRVKVKGKSTAVTVYEIFDADLPEIREGKLATKKDFEQALLLYNQQYYKEAAQQFQACLRQNPMDQVAKIYLKRCQFMASSQTSWSKG